MKWTVPRIWEGGTAVIIGGGPSILKQFEVPEYVIKDVYAGRLPLSAYSPFLEPIHKMHCIAVNVAYKIGPWIDVVFFGDVSTWAEDKNELIKFKGLRVTCASGLDNDTRLKHLQRNDKPVKRGQTRRDAISTDPSVLSWNNNSGSASINLAVHFGVKRIILLGFDMKLDEDSNQHWHKLYTTSKLQLESTFRRHLSPFSSMKEDLDKLGIEVINANPDSRIECFQRMNFKDIKL